MKPCALRGAQATHVGRRVGTLVFVLVLAGAAGCAPSNVIGPLSHEQEERDHLLDRARRARVSTDVLEKVVPPLTFDEMLLAHDQDVACRTSYMRKNGLTWTGSILVAVAAGITIGGAYAAGINDTTGKIIYGVSAGTMATLGGGLVALGGIIQQRYTDRGCVTKVTAK